MSFLGDIWNGLQDLLRGALEAIHGGVEPAMGVAAWGWAIIILTLGVRILLLPIAAKQFTSMRAMQQLQPKVKAIQKKHKVDRDLMRKDPEKYKQRKQKMNEEMMGLYKEHGVNPASGCLPLLLQAPIFFALFRVLQSFEPLANAPFYFFTSGITAVEAGGPSGLGASPKAAGPAGWLLVVLIAATMFITQKQMMARRATDDEQSTQQQKIMLYVMPVFLAAISVSLPLGVLLYWVTTNAWQYAQQALILREAKEGPEGSGQGASAAPSGGDGGGSGRTKRRPRATDTSAASSPPAAAAKNKPKAKPRGRPDHLPGGKRSGR